MSLLDTVRYCYDNITPFQTAMVISFLLLYVLYLFVRDMGIPPGPWGLPLFGYWPFLKSDTCHLQMQKLSRKYGDVFSFRAVGTLFIRLGTIKAVREAHVTNTESFQSRYSDSILSDSFAAGVPFANGEKWKILRKFFVSKIRDLNTIKKDVSNSVYDALKETVEELHDTKGKPMLINDLITTKSIIILRRIMFNDQGITAEELKTINDAYVEVMQGLTMTNMMLIGKFAKYCMYPFMPSVRRMKSYYKVIDDVVSDVVRRHKSEYKESHFANLMDSYYKERDERLKKGDPTAQFFTDKALADTLNQITTDGLQTVAVFIGNMIAHLLKYPDEQDKIYEEILEVTGPNRLPTLEDKNKLPYTNAFIYEVSRFTDFFPLFPNVECSKECTVNGYKIPVGAVTIVDFYGGHRNPKDFENPDEFNPSRYLPSPDKQRPELPILFGLGKRSCIGEGFSMILTFLFVTAIIQNFRLSLAEGSKGPSTAFWSAEKLIICAHPRSHKSH